jgi:hypothetical protein
LLRSSSEPDFFRFSKEGALVPLLATRPRRHRRERQPVRAPDLVVPRGLAPRRGPNRRGWMTSGRKSDAAPPGAARISSHCQKRPLAEGSAPPRHPQRDSRRRSATPARSDFPAAPKRGVGSTQRAARSHERTVKPRPASPMTGAKSSTRALGPQRGFLPRRNLIPSPPSRKQTVLGDRPGAGGRRQRETWFHHRGGCPPELATDPQCAGWGEDAAPDPVRDPQIDSGLCLPRKASL